MKKLQQKIIVIWRKYILATAGGLRANRYYWLQVTILATLGVLAEHMLDEHHVMLPLRYRIYDLQTQYLNRSKEAAIDVSFVEIDDQAFWKGEFARRLPLKRDYVARLLDAVEEDKPSVVVLDFDFRSPTPDGSNVPYSDYDHENETLRQSITRALDHGNKVVLARSIDTDSKGEEAEQADIFDGLPANENLLRGYIQFLFDLRNIPMCREVGKQHLDSLALAMLHARFPDEYRDIAGSRKETCDTDRLGLQFGKFISPARFSKHIVSAGSVLARSKDAQTKLQNHVVIICGTWHQHSFETGPPVDYHDSPAGEIPGAYVHANYFEALVLGHHFDSVSEIYVDITEIAVIFFSALIILHKKEARWKLLATCFPVGAMIICSYLILQNLGAFFECIIPVIVLIVHIAIDHILEWRKLAHEFEKSHQHSNVAVQPD